MRLCPGCEPIRRAWQENLPRLDCEWPGRACPRIDSRTPPAVKVAEWDRKNREQIETIEAVCLRSHRPIPHQETYP
jgi:hypothetical protein